MAGTSEAGTSRSTGTSAYDVFVSFRGPDTREGFTDHLYETMTREGIRVFRDTEEIRHGEEIGDELRRAIPDSRIYVVVFSGGYASSAWCLRELAMMVGCRGDKASGKVVLPIFYKVSPGDVKLQTDLYRGALDKHREKYKEGDVKKWEEALTEVGGISGLEYKRDTGEGKFVSDVVSDILNKLNIRDRILPDHLIGMDDLAEKVMGMLDCQSPYVRVVMLHGMGGIGKTTLANVIFNKISSRFDGCSFLADVRESLSTGVGGVEKLQNKLLKDVFGKSDGEIGDRSDGMNEIQRRLGNRKVLIIFDDVSESGQLKKLVGNFDFFGSGTRIMVTTRDRSVCEGLMRSSDIAYEMEGMRDDHALQLFSRHAFGGVGPPDDFFDLSKQVIRTTGNLPLALEVIGRHLLRKEKNVWEYTLEKLQRVPHKDVLKILRISYDGLEEREKQIFLDIACFDHYVMPREYASYMWEACGYYPKCGLDVLQNRSLMKVLNVDDNYEDRYWMHDLIREMGREIVRSESLLHCPGMRSRLWDPKEAVNVVNQKQGTHHVLAIDLRFGILYPYTGEEFEGMSNLRFLHLRCGPQLIGEFSHFRTKLLWLRWDVFRKPDLNPSFFKMDNLVVLEITGNGITDDSILRMPNLRVLDIYTAGITRMPDLSHFPKLEIIHLKSCAKLKELHSSVGVLRDLKCLKVEGCRDLKRLPEELGSAKALQELIFVNCCSIVELPESIGGLGDLRILRGERINIRKLPSTIGNLKSLEVLHIETKYILYEIARRPPSLEAWKLARCNLSGLSSLRSLILYGPDKVRELLGIEKLSGLQELKLYVRGQSILASAGLGALSRLEKLHLRNTIFMGRPGEDHPWSIWSETTWLRGLNNMENLSYLTLEWWMHVNLSDLGWLRRLRYLRLAGCESIGFSGIERMEFLEELDVSCCKYFRSEIPDLSNLRRLKRMVFAFCNSLQRVPRVSGDCHLRMYNCGIWKSFDGPYMQYRNESFPHSGDLLAFRCVGNDIYDMRTP